MLLANPNYSCMYSYAKLVKKLFNETSYEVKYKCYDKQENNIISFNCFNIESLIKTDENLILKEIKYEGYLNFEYDKSTNQVFISSVPKIKYLNTEILVFTSDIAQVIVDKLKNYIPAGEIKLSFSNPLLIIATDDNVRKLIPSFEKSNNYILFNNVYEKIENEEKEIINNTNQYKRKQARLEKSKELSLTKKRKILNIDPNEFSDIKDFEKELSNKLLMIWGKKIENIKRHLNANEDKYKEILLNYIIKSNTKEHIDDFEYILRQYLLELCCSNKNIPEECFTQYPLSKESYITIKNNMDYRRLNSKAKMLFEVWKYFCEYELKENEINIEKLNLAVNYIFDFDLSSELGVISHFNYLTGHNDLRYETRLEHFRKKLKDKNVKLTGFELYQLFLRHDTVDKEFYFGYDYSIYHPLFKDFYNKFKDICDKNDNDFYAICLDMKEQNLRIPTLDLIVQIDRLKEQLNYYETLINEPNKVVLNFYKDSRCWGSLMQIPYWKRLYRDQKKQNETYNLIMIKPGVKKIDTDFDDFIRFADTQNTYGSKTRNNIIKRELIHKSWNFKATTYSIIMILDSLDDEQTRKLTEYAFLGGTYNILFICESIEKERVVKDEIVNVFLGWYYDVGAFNYVCDVIVDPTYYESFLMDTPNNKNLWKKYEYGSDYKYSRKELLGFDSKLETALKYSINGYYMPTNLGIGNFNIDNWLFDELLFGDYSNERIFVDEYESYLNDLSLETKNKKHIINKI